MYRNKNQHGKTKHYRCLAKVHKNLTMIPIDRLAVFESAICEVIIGTSGKKARLKEASIYVSDLKTLLEICVETSDWCLKARDAIQVQLQQKVFVPLLTAYLTITARIFTLLEKVQTKFYSLFESLRKLDQTLC
jgi:hypothetical protein